MTHRVSLETSSLSPPPPSLLRSVRLFWAFCLLCHCVLAGCSPRAVTPAQPTATSKESAARASAADQDQVGNSGVAALSETDLDADRVTAAREALATGNVEFASEQIRHHLLLNPGDVPALFLAAEIEARRGAFTEAVALLDEIPQDDPEAGLPALGQSADWMLLAGNWPEAEKRFQQVLAIVSQANVARRRLAYLFNRQGRRQEACAQVQALCRAGDVTQAELHTLINQSDAVYDELRDGGGESSGVDFNDFSPIGASAEARIEYSNNRFKQALDLLRQPARDDALKPSGKAFFGRLAVEVDDQEAIEIWFNTVDARQRTFSDYWVALGTWILRQGNDPEGSTRAFCEALTRDPTDWIAMSRLETCMDLAGDTSQSAACRRRATLLRKTIQLNNRIVGQTRPRSDDIEQLADLLDQLHRPVEAVMWRAISASYTSEPQQKLAELNARRRSLVAQVPQKMRAIDALAGLDPSRFAMPSEIEYRSSQSEPGRDGKRSDPPLEPEIVDVAKAHGLEFQYTNAEKPKLRDLQLYEQFGGGVVAIDYDLDGNVDLYFNQGGADPKIESERPVNQLFRNLDGGFVPVGKIGVHDNGYGQGVTSGDWNQDGFTDLVVANFGVNRLFVNNGDGTFRPQAGDKTWERPLWTASIAMADVTGDSLPDIVETNYVEDETVHDVVPRGPNGRFVRFQGPESYQPAEDRIFVGRPDGSMQGIPLRGPNGAVSHGLGLVISDIDGKSGNDIFVANDTDPNQLWCLAEGSEPEEPTFVNLAGVRGCAYSQRGGSGASMGIAAADFDRNGTIDLHVTNFYNEPVHLYLQSESRIFIDQAVKSDLYEPSMQVLGFGTEAFDYDNNGTVDLAVVNGHIDDLQFKGAPHKMPPQLFGGMIGRFEALDVQDAAGYWTRPAIGRGLIRLDFNRDGRIDLVATHHDAPVALLENRTRTDYHWLQLQLVGTSSERDAIGARVTITAGQQRFVDIVTAGDGYACKNESMLPFGLGTIGSIDKIDVRWPSGTEQSFRVSDLDRRYLLVEDEAEAYLCSAP